MQRTLAAPVSYTGTALHSGKKVNMTLRPAEPGRGIRFCRMDLPGRPEIPARVEYVTDTMRSTTLGRDGVSVRTVEHLLAALHALRIDNVLVELDQEELPAADGSAREFCHLVQHGGIHEQGPPRQYRRLLTPVYVADRGRYMVALPADELRVSYTFVTNHPAVGTQYGDFSITAEVFLREIAAARTVGFAAEIEAMQRQGLALGGSLDIAVVVGEDDYLNQLRYPDEIVRHKILDIVGDLALVGPLQAHVIAVKSGHMLDAMLARKIAAQAAAG